eukprot:1146457-Pelagomonas_calceolata.AAC.2
MERIDNESGFVQVYFCNTADAATSRPHKTLAQEPEQPSSAYTHSRLIPGDSKVAGPRTYACLLHCKTLHAVVRQDHRHTSSRHPSRTVILAIAVEHAGVGFAVHVLGHPRVHPPEAVIQGERFQGNR